MSCQKFKLFYVPGLSALLLSTALIISCDKKENSSPSGPVDSSITGRFLDSAVEGLVYSSNGKTGVTDKEGKFVSQKDAKIRFTIGDITIGETTVKEIITPIDLVPEAKNELHSKVTNITRFLQTLDDDANPDNGITITESVRLLAEGMAVDFSKSTIEFSSDSSVQNVISELTNKTSKGERPLIEAIEAQNHLRTTVADIASTGGSVRPRITIEEIWSDQFPGIKSNRLGHQIKEAGEIGNEKGYVLLGARKDNILHGKALLGQLDVDESDLPYVLVRLGYIDSDKKIIPVGSGTLNNRIASLTVSLKDDVDFNISDLSQAHEFYVLAGIDKNRDGNLDMTSINNEVIAASPWRFKAISQYNYNENVIYFKAGDFLKDLFGSRVLLGYDFSIAPEFAMSFVEGRKINLDGYSYSTVSLAYIESEFQDIKNQFLNVTDDYPLSHKVGIDYLSSSGLLGNYHFKNNSSLADSVLKSELFTQLVDKYVIAPLASSITEQQKNDKQLDINKPIKIALHFLEQDPDLYFTFGTVFFNLVFKGSALCTNGSFVISDLNVEGYQLDYYDWNYESDPKLDKRMATIQAGFGTLGKGGNIFRIRVDLDSSLKQYAGTDLGVDCTSEEDNNDDDEDNNNDNNGSSLCENFPPPPGIFWTYKLVGTNYTFTTVTEKVNELVGGYVVYRLGGSDSPPGLGEYYGCDEIHGEVEIATDWWDLYNPSETGRDYYEPPLYNFQFGDPIGTVCEWKGTLGGEKQSVVSEVVAYESITVPYGSFTNVLKGKITDYDEDGEIFDGPTFFWFDSGVGLIRAEEIDTGSAIELINYGLNSSKETGGTYSSDVIKPPMSLLRNIIRQKPNRK